MTKRSTVTAKRDTFRRLHEKGSFILPNPWDAGSAVILESLGFKALASTSAGFAWSQAKPDNGMLRDKVLDHLTTLVNAVEIPIHADFENAFATEPEDVNLSVSLAVETGIAGLSIEDSAGGKNASLYDIDLSVDRIAAARAAIDRNASGVLLTARSEGFFIGQPNFDETIKRLKAYADAGADCLYAPGITDEKQISLMIQAVAPKPVNVLTLGLPMRKLSELGARRISVGGALARNAYTLLWQSAKDILEQGDFEISKPAVKQGVALNPLFSKFQARPD